MSDANDFLQQLWVEGINPCPVSCPCGRKTRSRQCAGAKGPLSQYSCAKAAQCKLPRGSDARQRGTAQSPGAELVRLEQATREGGPSGNHALLVCELQQSGQAAGRRVLPSWLILRLRFGPRPGASSACSSQAGASSATWLRKMLAWWPSEIRSESPKIQTPKDPTSNNPLGFGIWSLGLSIWDPGFGVWDSGFGVWDLGFWGLGVGIRVCECGIWDLGYGIWDLGLGLWDLG